VEVFPWGFGGIIANTQLLYATKALPITIALDAPCTLDCEISLTMVATTDQSL
jgi:hypothetical protein